MPWQAYWFDSCHLMEPLQYYNVKKDVWHTHILEPGTAVVVVENIETGLSNSPVMDLTEEQRARIATLHK